MSRARGQNSRAVILMSHPFLAALDVPERGFGTAMDRIDGFLRRVDHQAWPGLKPGEFWSVKAVAFAKESDSDEFVRIFSGRRIQP